MKKTPVKSKKVVSEKMITLDQHATDIKRYIGAVTEDFQHRVSAIAEQFSGLNDKLDTHTEMIGRLMTDVEEIKVGMNDKVSRNEFNKLESRLVSLESFVFTQRAKSNNKAK